MAAITEPIGNFLKSLPFFSGLADPAVTRLLQSAPVKTYPKNKTLFLLGDKADRFFIILDGWIKLYRGTSEGEEAVVALYTRGDAFGEAAIFEQADYPFSAQAAEEVRLIEIPGTLLRELAKTYPVLMDCVMASMSRELHKLQMENEHLSIMSAPQRVACLLLQLSSGMIGSGGTFSFPYDKSLAAARLGMKPETFSRALAQLKPFGVIVAGSEIRIDSFNRLIDFSCGHCSAQPGECRGSREYCGLADCCKASHGKD